MDSATARGINSDDQQGQGLARATASKDDGQRPAKAMTNEDEGQWEQR